MEVAVGGSAEALITGTITHLSPGAVQHSVLVINARRFPSPAWEVSRTRYALPGRGLEEWRRGPGRLNRFAEPLYWG